MYKYCSALQLVVTVVQLKKQIQHAGSDTISRDDLAYHRSGNLKQKTLGVISLASKKQEIRDNRFPYEKINL